jgi:hypothetical protein
MSTLTIEPSPLKTQEQQEVSSKHHSVRTRWPLAEDKDVVTAMRGVDTGHSNKDEDANLPRSYAKAMPTTNIKCIPRNGCRQHFQISGRQLAVLQSSEEKICAIFDLRGVMRHVLSQNLWSSCTPFLLLQLWAKKLISAN